MMACIWIRLLLTLINFKLFGADLSEISNKIKEWKNTKMHLILMITTLSTTDLMTTEQVLWDFTSHWLFLIKYCVKSWLLEFRGRNHVNYFVVSTVQCLLLGYWLPLLGIWESADLVLTELSSHLHKCTHQRPILLTWFNFNPSLDK